MKDGNKSIRKIIKLVSVERTKELTAELVLIKIVKESNGKIVNTEESSFDYDYDAMKE